MESFATIIAQAWASSGIDRSEGWVFQRIDFFPRSHFFTVKEKSALFKSMLASKNLPTPIKRAADGHQWLRVLAAELALRLKDAREEMPTLWPKTIVLHTRKGSFPAMEITSY